MPCVKNTCGLYNIIGRVTTIFCMLGNMAIWQIMKSFEAFSIRYLSIGELIQNGYSFTHSACLKDRNLQVFVHNVFADCGFCFDHFAGLGIFNSLAWACGFNKKDEFSQELAFLSTRAVSAVFRSQTTKPKFCLINLLPSLFSCADQVPKGLEAYTFLGVEGAGHTFEITLSTGLIASVGPCRSNEMGNVELSGHLFQKIQARLRVIPSVQEDRLDSINANDTWRVLLLHIYDLDLLLRTWRRLASSENKKCKKYCNYNFRHGSLLWVDARFDYRNQGTNCFNAGIIQHFGDLHKHYRLF